MLEMMLSSVAKQVYMGNPGVVVWFDNRTSQNVR